MATLNISMADSLKKYAQDQPEHKTPSSYISSLIRADKEKAETQQRVETMLLEGLNSGDPIPMTPKYWADKKAQLKKELSSK